MSLHEAGLLTVLENFGMADEKKQKMDLDLEQRLALEEAEQDRSDDRRELKDRRKAVMEFEGPDRRVGSRRK